MKMTAIPFLHAAIREPVRLLFEDKRSCELDGTCVVHPFLRWHRCGFGRRTFPQRLQVALQTRARTRRLNPIFCEWGSVCIALQLIYVKFDDGGHQKALDRVESQKT